MSELEYATAADGSQVAYRVLSTGFNKWIAYVPGLLYSIESIELDAPYARFMRGLTDIANVVTIERQGIGASDMVDFDRDIIEQWAGGIVAVLDEIGVQTTVAVGYAIGAGTCLELALRYPDRVSDLVLFHLAIGDYPELGDQMAAIVARDADVVAAMLAMTVPSRIDDPSYMRWNVEAGQRAANPGTAARYWRAALSSWPDVRTLGDVSARTLILQRRDTVLPRLEDAETILSLIPNATLRVLDGADMIPNAGDVESLVAEIAEFVTGERRAPLSDRPIVALLFTDIVDSTRQVVEAGDDRWAAVLNEHDELVRRTLAVHGGELVKNTGDGILATFESASRAINGAKALRAALHDINLNARMGIHVAEVDRRGGDIAGVGVHLAARILAEAKGDEILVSETVTHVTFGGSFTFEPHSKTELKGLEGTWAVHRVK